MSRPDRIERLSEQHIRAWFGDTHITVELTRERAYSGDGLPGDEVHRDLYELAVERLSERIPSLAEHVLDAPCGSGYGTDLLRRLAPVVGCDRDPQAVAFARLRAAGATIEPQRLGEILPYADGQFGAVVCIEGIEHVDKDRAAVREFHRILCNRGVLFVTTPERDRFEGIAQKRELSPFHVREYSQSELACLLHENGFEIHAWDRRYWTMAVTAVRRD